MSDLQVTNAFVDGDVVQAANFNTNYSDIVTYINNRNSGSSTWDGFYSTHATTIPLVANNSTGTQDIVQFKDNGVEVFSINDGGYVNAPFQYFARMYFSSAQPCVNITATKIPWDAGDQTVSAMSAAGTFTAPATGKYLFSCALLFPQDISHGGSVVITPEVRFYKNGSQYSKFKAQNAVGVEVGASASLCLHDIISLGSNETVEVYQMNGGAVNATLAASSTKNYLNIMKLS